MNEKYFENKYSIGYTDGRQEIRETIDLEACKQNPTVRWVMQGIRPLWQRPTDPADLPALEPEGHWLGNLDIPVYRVGSHLYALDGWNGEEYTRCWKCLSPFEASPDDRTYTLAPTIRATLAGTDLSALEENSPEWDKALEVVDFHVY